MQGLARWGCAAEVVCRPPPDFAGDASSAEWLTQRGWKTDECQSETMTLDTGAIVALSPPRACSTVRGVAISMLTWDADTTPDDVTRDEDELLRLFESVFSRFRPDVLICYGGDGFSRAARAYARAQARRWYFRSTISITSSPPCSRMFDAVVVPSAFAAEYYFRRSG